MSKQYDIGSKGEIKSKEKLNHSTRKIRKRFYKQKFKCYFLLTLGRRNHVSSSSNETPTSIAASVTSTDGFAMNDAATRNSHLAHYSNATHVSLLE